MIDTKKVQGIINAVRDADQIELTPDEGRGYFDYCNDPKGRPNQCVLGINGDYSYYDFTEQALSDAWVEGNTIFAKERNFGRAIGIVLYKKERMKIDELLKG
jgi:hypothetical protein